VSCRPAPRPPSVDSAAVGAGPRAAV